MARPAKYRVRSVEDRMAAYCVPAGDCVVWSGPVDGRPVIFNGVRRVNVQGYVLGLDRVPDGRRVVSSCGNQLCVNPAHLWLERQGLVGPRISPAVLARRRIRFRVKPPKAFVGPVEPVDRRFWRECGFLFLLLLPELVECRRRTLRQREKEWRVRNPEKARIKRRLKGHRRRGAIGRFTKADIDRLFLFQRGKCAICRCGLDDYDIDHVMPIALGGTNDPENLQLLCKPCNNRKGAYHPVEHMQSLGFLL